MLKNSQTSIPSISDCNRNIQVQTNVDSLDVRIHQRIRDVQKHLHHKCVKVNKRLIYNYWRYVSIHSNVKSLSNMYSIDMRPEQRLSVISKRQFIRCENSSQNLGCSKTSTSQKCYTKEKNYFKLFDICDYSLKR